MCVCVRLCLCLWYLHHSPKKLGTIGTIQDFVRIKLAASINKSRFISSLRDSIAKTHARASATSSLHPPESGAKPRNQASKCSVVSGI